MMGADQTDPFSMQPLWDHMRACGETVTESIFAEIRTRGRNTSPTPFYLNYDGKEWWVSICVNMAAGTFEVETHHKNRYLALINALTRLRREFSSR